MTPVSNNTNGTVLTRDQIIYSKLIRVDWRAINFLIYILYISYTNKPNFYYA